MASCSLYTPGAKESLLIPKQELDNLLVFERIDAEVANFVDRINKIILRETGSERFTGTRATQRKENTMSYSGEALETQY